VKPFLRPTSRARLAPVGWVAERAGEWVGREVEVVYDPTRHDVVLFRNDPGDDARADLSSAGYRRYASDGQQEMWVRDKSSTPAASLDRPTPAPAPAREQRPSLSVVGDRGRGP
jgi:hypothetical protein